MKKLILIGLLMFLTACSNVIEDPREEPIGEAAQIIGAVSLEIPIYTESVDFTNKVVILDKEDGEIEVTNEHIVFNDLDLTELGEYTVVYSYTDTDNNITNYYLPVTVIDNESPLLILTGERYIFLLEGETYIDPGVVMQDNVDETCNVLSDNINIIDTNTVGVYNLLYQCEDSSGNKSNEVSRTVEVVELLTYEYQIGDKVIFTGYYSDGETERELATSGTFYVRSVDHLSEYPIGLSVDTDSDLFWVKDEDILLLTETDLLETVMLDVGLLHQYDYSEYLTGSTMTISGYGCALTSLTMVVNYLNNTNLTPEDTNPDLVQSGLVYWVNTNTGEYENLQNHYYPSYESYRIQKSFADEEAYGLLKQRIKEKLDDGYPVIVNIVGNTTHYVVAYGYYYNSHGELRIKINDPGSSYRFELDDLPSKYPYFFEGFIYYTKN